MGPAALHVLEDGFGFMVERIESVRARCPAPQDWLSASEALRFAGMLNSGRRDEFLGGRWLIRELLATRAGGQAMDWPIENRSGQAPHGERAHFFSALSISHGGGWIAAAAAHQAIGIDVESADRFLDPAVFDDLLGSQDESPGDRLERWVAAEALLKRDGHAALPDNLRQLQLTRATTGPVLTLRWADACVGVALVQDWPTEAIAKLLATHAEAQLRSRFTGRTSTVSTQETRAYSN